MSGKGKNLKTTKKSASSDFLNAKFDSDEEDEDYVPDEGIYFKSY